MYEMKDYGYSIMGSVVYRGHKINKEKITQIHCLSHHLNEMKFYRSADTNLIILVYPLVTV